MPLIAKAKEYLTPWQRIDHSGKKNKEFRFLILPPSQPFGIMWGDPMLTFVSATMIDGDREKIIQSIMHTWFGNSITPLNWSHLWLSEGFKLFMTRKITEDVFGYSSEYADQSKHLGLI